MDTYTPEEFANKLKSRGLTTLTQARRYVSATGKDFYTEDDFIKAYHEIEHGFIGRKIVRKQGDGEALYFERDRRGILRYAGAECS